MAGLLQFLTVAALVCVAVASDVVILTESNFDTTLQNADVALVEFFAPWCGHCKKLAPEYEKAATELAKNDPPVVLASVDATVESSLGSKFGITGYPTLKIFRKGVESGPYEGPRTASGIVKFMQKQSGPSSKELKTVADLEKVLSATEPVLVGAFEKADSALAKAFAQLADTARDDFKFAHTNDAAVIAKLDAGSNNVVFLQPKHLHTKFEEPRAVYGGKPNPNSIKDFAAEKVSGLVGHMTPDNEKQFKKPLLVAFYDVDFARNPSGAKYIRNRLLKLASELGSALQFAVANVADFGQYQQSLGIRAGETSVAILDASGAKYVMTKSPKFNVDEVKAFVDQFTAGSLEEYIKSEPLPANNNEPVKIAVGKNFKSLVDDSDDDVFIEFYAPWCGHCKSLAPKWEELAKKFENDDGITIAKMDATLNDPPSQFQVQGYPTLYFVPANNKKSPKKYDGPREVKDMLDYIKKNRSTKPSTHKEL